MQKSNIYQHNVRLNLDDERHLKVPRYLMNINEDVYKSKNGYIIRAILQGAEQANSVTEDVEWVEKRLLTDEQKNIRYNLDLKANARGYDKLTKIAMERNARKS